MLSMVIGGQMIISDPLLSLDTLVVFKRQNMITRLMTEMRETSRRDYSTSP
jgi:hypothetical protein